MKLDTLLRIKKGIEIDIMKHHIVTSNTKVYIRHNRNGVPENSMMASAYEGFSNLGAEIASYTSIDDIDFIEDLGPETMIVGYIALCTTKLLSLRSFLSQRDYWWIGF